MNNKRIQGYSLLEIIIVLAIIGLIMIALANYAKKEMESVTRQNITNVLANEIAGMVKFVHEDNIYLENTPNPVKNPFYDTGNNLPAYSTRVRNTQVNDDVATTGYLQWDVSNLANSHRGYFRDKRCAGTGPGGTITSNLEFVKEYINCNIDNVLHTQEFRLERIDIAGDPVKRSIERIDFFVGYYPNVKEENIFFENYVNEIEKSFKDRKLVYSNAFIIERPRAASEAQWQLIRKNNSMPIERVELGQLASYLDKITNKNAKDYGIRFSFVVGDGQYLKSDGSVGADKLCWNAKTKMSGPCLSGNPVDDNQLILSTATNNNDAPSLCWDMKANSSKVCIAPNESQTGLHLVDEVTVAGVTTKKTATLMANLVMKDDDNGELTTVPKVSYLSFKGDGDNIVQDSNYTGNITSAIERNGLIHFPKQTCPVNPESPNPNPIHLYPRLSVAISSIVPVTMADPAVGLGIDLSKESTNRGGVIDNVGKFGGVALQIDQVAAGIMDTTADPQWVISATTGVYGNDGVPKNHISPKSLSIIAFTWCSSIPQP